MSFDFAIEFEDERLEEPFFDDTHPALGEDGTAGTVVVTPKGYGARCGNYTSNVSGMWTRCLTGAAQAEEMAWAGDDARTFNASGRTCSYRGDDGEWVRDVPMPVDRERLKLRDLAGKTGRQLAPLFQRAVLWGVEHLDELREQNPDNGWGNAEGAVTYLWDVQRMCERYPDGKLYLSS